MRTFIFVFLFFISQHSLAAWQRGGGYAAGGGFTANQNCLNYINDTKHQQEPRVPYKCISGDWYYDYANTCPVSQTYNIPSQKCSTACGTGTITGFTSAGQGFVACISDCQVNQIGSAVCQGVGTNPDSYCTADYQKTGKYCPDPTKQVDPCTTCGASSSSSLAASSVASSQAIVASSVPTSSPSASSAAAQSSVAAASSQSGSGSASSSGSGGSGGTGGGDDGGGDDGGSGGDSSSGSASSAGGGTGGTGSGSVTGGASCDSPPVCSGDALQCNLILQTYQLRCSGKSLHARTSSEPTLNLEQKLIQTKQKYTNEFNALKTQFSSTLALSIAGGGGALASNVQTLKGAQVELGIAARADFFSLIGALFMFAAAILSAYIILEK